MLQVRAGVLRWHPGPPPLPFFRQLGAETRVAAAAFRLPSCSALAGWCSRCCCPWRHRHPRLPPASSLHSCALSHCKFDCQMQLGNLIQVNSVSTSHGRQALMRDTALHAGALIKLCSWRSRMLRHSTQGSLRRVARLGRVGRARAWIAPASACS